MVFILVLLIANTRVLFFEAVTGLPVAVLLATVAIAFERTRQYAVGFLMGLGGLLIIAGGACVGLLAMLAVVSR